MSTADEVAQLIIILMPNDYMTREVIHADGAGRFVYLRSIDSTDN